MADVALVIGDRTHIVSVRDGDEAEMERLGRYLDERWPQAWAAAGGRSPDRAMLFVALMLADALEEARRPPPGMITDGMLVNVAERLEKLAGTLEGDPSGA